MWLRCVMENSSPETDFQSSCEERKLYAVDSLNNLNEQNLCVAQPPHQSMYAKCHLSTTSQHPDLQNSALIFSFTEEERIPDVLGFTLVWDMLTYSSL
ncbi:hypothetical protein lerEdw1_003990 [Lerista edwardsae]|nr:hypothetical protein lerEdw1_003990 [Lerista edwardsae]